MVSLPELWLPIVVAAVLVFVVSSVIHMLLPVHKGDHAALPQEEKVLAALRDHGVGPGSYAFPWCGSMKDMGSPETLEKYKRGPVGFLRVLPSGMPSIGKALVQWFLFSLLVGLVAAYVAGRALGPGSAFSEVVRVAGTVAIAGYALGDVQQSIWKGQSWATTGKFVLDGVAYGLVTGLAFGWLWPAAGA